MAVAAGGLSQLWTEWGIQILVLVSFALQLLILAFGGMRRRGLSAWQRVALWFAYLLADSTAIYALGHLSITSASREHRLVAFWAPFLLVHLGGPDNVTAYALEDSSLWLRHLQTLAVQVLGAAYVIYKYMADSGTLLLMASVSMFVAGVAKYGERTWALRCANVSTSGSKTGEEELDKYQLLKEADMGEEEVMLRAHAQLAVCKSSFEDTKLLGPRRRSEMHMRMRIQKPMETKKKPYYEEDIFRLLEMELSLMYDMLYTKAAVIHTWYGFCIHLISLIATSTAFVLFQLSVVGIRGRGNTSRYNRADVFVSYVLMVGALVLEVISACRAVFSSWTCYYIVCKAEEYGGRAPGVWLEWLHRYVLSSVRKPFSPARRRRWRGTIGQYNLLHMCTQDKTDLGSRLATKLGCKDWWNKLRFSGTFSGSETLPMQKFKDLLVKGMEKGGLAARRPPLTTLNTRGRFTLQWKEAYKGIAQWSVLNIQFDESILIWHIATDLFISEYKAKGTGHHHELELVEVIRVLSNYMMFLLVKKPNMLPGRARRNVYLEACTILELKWQREHESVTAASPRSWNTILKELFYREGPNGPMTTQVEKLANGIMTSGLVSWYAQQHESGPVNLDQPIDRLCWNAAYLGKELLNLHRPDKLEVIFGVWVEMVLFAAEQCHRDLHARELSNGGEFMTIVWLLVLHWKEAYVHNLACDLASLSERAKLEHVRGGCPCLVGA